jgi:hypothetical protein
MGRRAAGARGLGPGALGARSSARLVLRCRSLALTWPLRDQGQGAVIYRGSRASVDGKSWTTSVWRSKNGELMLPVPRHIRGTKEQGETVHVEIAFDPED